MVPFAACANCSSSPSTCWSRFAKLVRPGGVRAVAAESLLLKHQLLISNRSRQRAPNLTSIDRFVLGLTTLFVSPRRIAKLGALDQACHAVQISSGLGGSQIPPALFFLVASPQTRSQRSFCGTHRGHRRDEATQSQVWLCAHRPADRSCLRHHDRQRCRSPRAREALSARRSRISWPFLADVHRAGQGQPLEP